MYNLNLTSLGELFILMWRHIFHSHHNVDPPNIQYHQDVVCHLPKLRHV